MKTTFIYSLACPETGSIKYVGKADNPQRRLKAHMRRPCSTGMWVWRGLLKASGLMPVLSILEECAIEIWGERERWWINHFRAMPHSTMLNVLNGGNGSGECAEVTREKKRIARSGRVNSPETRRKISESNMGKIQTAESRLKISAALKGKKQNPESAAKSAAYRRTPESKARQSAAIKGRGHTDESKAKMSKARWTKEARLKEIERLADPAIKAKMSEVTKSQWQDEEYKQKQMLARNTPEYRKKLSDGVRRSLQNPEIAARKKLCRLGKRNTPESIERMRQSARLREDLKISIRLAAMTV